MNECPPIQFLTQVIQNTNKKAALLYLQLWKDQNSDSIVVVDKKKTKEKYFTTEGRLYDLLLMLHQLGLVNMHQTPLQYLVELTRWDEI